MGQLILKRAAVSRTSGEWNENDFDVLADVAVVGRIFKAKRHRSGCRGCGRWPSDIMKIAPRRTAMPRRARPRWRHSLRTGGGELKESPGRAGAFKAGHCLEWAEYSRPTPRAALEGMLFECAICPAITMLMLVGLVGLLLVVRIQPFDASSH
jgi:hypothetical protein